MNLVMEPLKMTVCILYKIANFVELLQTTGFCTPVSFSGLVDHFQADEMGSEAW